MKATLSVIVPVYNAGPYIILCLESIIRQLWQGCKLIVIDDGSTDRSAAHCRRYADSFPDKIILIKSDRAGQATARNLGLTLAHSDYIAFCDADDAYLPGALQAMVDVLENNADCNITVGQYSRRITQFLPESLRMVDSTEAIISTLYQRPRFHNSVWATVYRRSVFNGIRFADGRFYEDLEIIPRLYSRSPKIAYLDSPVYFYRHNPTSYINTWNPSRADAVWAARSVLDFVRENVPAAVPAATSRLFSAAFNIFNLATKNGHDDIADRCWNTVIGLRQAMLHDPNVRLKNKTGAALSFLGNAACSVIAKKAFR